jgi:hypothetical protein
MDVFKNFQELCKRFCIRLSGPIFGVKLNLHIYKTVKYSKTSSLSDIAAANVCIMKKTRGLYHVSERRYFNFIPAVFSDIVAILTAPAVCACVSYSSLLLRYLFICAHLFSLLSFIYFVHCSIFHLFCCLISSLVNSLFYSLFKREKNNSDPKLCSGISIL